MMKAALSKFARGTGYADSGRQLRTCPVVIAGKDHQRTILEESQQRAIGRGTQGPLPVIRRLIRRPGLSREPLNGLKKGAQGDIDDHFAPSAELEVFPQSGEKGVSGCFYLISSGENVIKGEGAANIGVNPGHHARIA